MAENVGTLQAALSLDTEEFRKKAKEAMGELDKVGKKMSKSFGEEPQKAIKDTGRETQRVTWAMRGYIKDTARVITGILIAQTFYRLIGVLQETAVEVHELATELETLGIALKYLMGEEYGHFAPKLLQDLETFTAKTPFAFMQVAESARSLLAAGTDLGQIVDTMTVLANVAAVAKVPIEELSALISSIRAKGRITAEELEQFGRMKIPARQILAEQLDVPLDWIQGKFLTKMPIETGINALLTGFLDKFGGAADEFSDTWIGMMSTIKDNLLKTMQQLYQPLLDYIQTNILPRWRQALTEMNEGVRTQGAYYLLERFIPPGMHDTIRMIIATLQHLGQTFLLLGHALKPVIGAFAEFIALFGATFLPVIAGVLRVLTQLIYYSTQASGAVRFLVGAIVGLSIAAPIAMRVLWLAKTIGLLTIAQTAAKAVMFLVTAVKALAVALIAAGAPMYAVVAILMLLAVMLGQVIKPLGGFLNNLWKSFSKLLGLDTSKFLQPPDEKGWSETLRDMEGMSGAIKPISSELEEVEDAADAAGKAFKKFLMPFDEVYAIPEALDAAGSAIEDGMFKYPDIGFPDVPSLGGGGFDFGPLFDPEELLNKNWWGTAIEWIKTQWNKFISWVSGWKIWDQLAEGAWKMVKWIGDTWDKIQTNWEYSKEKMKKKWDEFWGNLGVRWETFKENFTKGWNTFWEKLSDRWEDTKKKWSTFWENMGTRWDEFRENMEEKWDEFWEKLSDKWEDTKKKWDKFWGKLTDRWETFKEDMKKKWDTFWDNITTKWETFKDNIEKKWSTFWEKLTARWETFKEDMKKKWDTFWGALPVKWETFKEDMKKKWDVFWTDLKTRWETFTTDLKTKWGQFWTDLGTRWETFKSNLTTAWSTFWTNLTTRWETFKTTLKTAWNTFWTDLGTRWDTFKETVKTKWNTLWTDLVTRWETFKTTLKSSWDVFWTPFAEKVETMKNRVVEAWQDLKNKTASIWGGIKDTMRGLVNTIIGYVNKIIEAWNKLKFSTGKLKNPLTGKEYAGINIGTAQISPIPYLAKGGVITKDTLARIGEAGRSEAVIPLDKNALRPFAELIAELMPAQGQGTRDERPILHIGTLIASDQSLRELERRMRVVKAQEGQRVGGA